jgi:hypothetical protein
MEKVSITSATEAVDSAPISPYKSICIIVSIINYYFHSFIDETTVQSTNAVCRLTRVSLQDIRILNYCKLLL